MARSKSRAKERSANAWGLADRQHGVVTRRDLLALGFSPMAIEHRIERGRLHPVYRGVYAVGRPALTCEGRWMAAVLACGDNAALSHRSAAALWGIGEEGRRIEITVRQASQRRPGGLRARRRPSLTDEDIAIHKRIPTTCPIRTLLDLATVLGPAALERAIGEADKRDLTDPETMRAALAAYAGQPGVRALRAVLDRHTLRLSDSALERLFQPLALAAGLPQPLTQAEVNGFRVDFYWPDLGLVVETDGLRYHRTPSAQARDRVRDQAHTAAGLTALRFTHRQVRFEPAHVLDVLRRTTRNPRSGY